MTKKAQNPTPWYKREQVIFNIIAVWTGILVLQQVLFPILNLTNSTPLLVYSRIVLIIAVGWYAISGLMGNKKQIVTFSSVIWIFLLSIIGAVISYGFLGDFPGLERSATQDLVRSFFYLIPIAYFISKRSEFDLNWKRKRFRGALVIVGLSMVITIVSIGFRT